MKFSDDRIAHVSHLIHQGILKDRLVEYADVDRALREIKKGLIEYFKAVDEADQAARDKVASLKRGVLEGSREWEVLYRKYLEEELHKRGR